MAKTSATQLKANAKYDAANTRTLQLKLNKNTDKDILDVLDGLANKQGYIKELIRADMTGAQKHKSPKFHKTATRLKREEAQELANSWLHTYNDDNFNELYYFERANLVGEFIGEYVEADTMEAQMEARGKFYKAMDELIDHWKDVPVGEEDEYDADEGYKDGFDHPFDDPLGIIGG